jgi:hypothetical protein
MFQAYIQNLSMEISNYRKNTKANAQVEIISLLYPFYELSEIHLKVMRNWFGLREKGKTYLTKKRWEHHKIIQVKVLTNKILVCGFQISKKVTH